MYDSPCGELMLGDFGGRMCMCEWVTEHRKNAVANRFKGILGADFAEVETGLLKKASMQLDEYFRHERTEFDVPLFPVGSDFQRSVWQELINIPYGTTMSYMGVSNRIGNPKAVRAVANAIGANAINIFIPCHRVIGSNHKLTGYTGGLEKKHFLLELESIIVM